MRLAGQGSEEVQQVERPYTRQIYSLQIKLADQWNNASTGFEFDFCPNGPGEHGELMA